MDGMRLWGMVSNGTRIYVSWSIRMVDVPRVERQANNKEIIAQHI